ncbi:hypothetical protein GCM10010466_49810 [Planomonospora alba]|uniref:Sensor-like histidine kinase SenX3 n=1 Tax=Planomonospora alba TaxID=161354 RepID=A0ABP6NLS7_9ACTN
MHDSRRSPTTGLLDLPEVPALDHLTRMAARLLDAPAALVSLADHDRQVVVSATGAAEPQARRRSPLPPFLSEGVAAADGPLVVPDARADGRPSGDLTIGDLEAAACAAFPLHGPDGETLGALCAIDTRPRRWKRAQLELAGDLARTAEGEIAARHEALRLQAILDTACDAFVSTDAAGTVTAWNAAAERLFGWSAAEAVGRPVHELIIPERLRRAFLERAAEDRDGRSPAGHRIELTAADRTGREFPVEMALQTADEYGARVFHAFLHDITDRHADRRRTEEGETFLRALLDSLDVGVAACDSDGRVILTNRVLRELRPDIRGLHVRELADAYRVLAADGRTPLRPEDVPLARAFAGERIDGQEIVVCAAGRPPSRSLVNGRPIESADGRGLGAVVAVHDITDQHRVQTLTRAQHAVARVLADAASSEEAATGVAAAVTDALGWTCGEYWQVDADGSGLTRIGSWTRPGRDLSAFTGDGPVTLREGEGVVGEVWATGREIWVRDLRAGSRGPARGRDALRAGLRGAIALPVRSGRTILGVLVFYSDSVQDRDDELTSLLDGVCAHVGRYMERRRAEELALELAASRRQFNQIVTHVNDDVWTAEITPEGRARPVYVSTSGAGVLGRQVPPEDGDGGDMVAIVGRHVHPGDRAEFDAFCERLISGEPAEIKCRFDGLDGVTRWVWIRALPRREGDRLFVDGISTDVTEHHRMEEERERLLAREREQVRRLRELDRMKDELVAVVSHELRNPIGAIRGYTEMLLDAPDLGEEHRMFADIIDRTSAHLQRLVDDLLDLARLDSGGIVIDSRPVSLTRLVRQSVEDHRPEAEAKRLAVEVGLDRHLGVHADPVRLRQVMDNLLSNAVKYTPEGGRVTVTARHDGDEVVVAVADTGIGIPAEQYPQLFTRFFRASTAQEAGTKGTGLGLAITKAIVDAHGGEISAAPREGGGTVFTVRLPEDPAVGA